MNTIVQFKDFEKGSLKIICDRCKQEKHIDSTICITLLSSLGPLDVYNDVYQLRICYPCRDELFRFLNNKEK